MLILAQNDGTVIYKSRPYSIVSGQKIHFPTDRALLEAALQGHDIGPLLQYKILDFSQAEALQSHRPAELVAIVQEGEIVNVQAAPEPPKLYLFVEMDGFVEGAGETLYIKNDGVHAVTVEAEIWTGPEKDAALYQKLTHDPTTNAPLNGQWSLELVNVETGVLADSPLVSMVEGVVDYSYTTTISPAEVRLEESRLAKIGGCQLVLVTPVQFKVVR